MTRRAFTLVELLVVIAIIGLLSTIAVVSLSAARARSRDAKRMADLRQISVAVELYSDANGYLPTYNYSPSGGWCTYVNNASYPQFVNDIAPFMATVPSDPKVPKQAGDYFYKNINGTTKYTLCANMEYATGNSYDYTACIGGAVYNYCIFPNGS